jgi:hypothetical protein
MSLPIPASLTWASLIPSPITRNTLIRRWKLALTVEAAANSIPANASIATAVACSWSLVEADRRPTP